MAGRAVRKRRTDTEVPLAADRVTVSTKALAVRSALTAAIQHSL